MLSVAQDLSFKLVGKCTNKKKRRWRKKGMRGRRRTNAGGESPSIWGRDPLPLWKGKRKKGEKKDREKHGTPESDENVPGDREFLDATIYHPPLIGERRGNESMRECPGRIGGCARESFITIPSILRFAAPRLRQRKVVNRFERFARLQIAIFPEEKLVDLGWQRAKKGERGVAFRVQTYSAPLRFISR